MPALLALIDAVVAELGDDTLVAGIHGRAAVLRSGAGNAADSVVRAITLMQAASEHVGRSLVDTYQLVGERAVPLLSQAMAQQMRHHGTVHTFCLHLNSIVQSELQALIPTVPLPFVDVEMLDLSALRLSFIGDENALALARGLLGGVARCYGQEARFIEVSESVMSPAARASGRRYVDISFAADTRAEAVHHRPATDDRRRGPLAVALKGLFR